jgi:hypothetical protein
MKATELRIGNIVATAPVGGGIRIPNYKYPFVIHAIGIECECYNIEDNPATQAELPTFHITDLVGIPLTDEWLKKLGLNEVAGFWKWHRSAVYKHQDRWIYGILGEDNNSYYHVSEIKYVHQLQNLYFALTDDELRVGTK